jgi:hypothetical protein
VTHSPDLEPAAWRPGVTDDPAAEDSATAGDSSPTGRGAYPADDAGLADPADDAELADPADDAELADPDAQEDMELDDEIVVAEVIDEAPDDRVAGDPVADDLVTDGPVATDKVTDDPVTADLVTEDPVTEDPVTGDPVTEDPVAGDPVTADLVTDDPLAAGPATDAPANAQGSAPAAAGPADRGAGRAGLSQHWHNIQATFVDDPSGAVRLAAEAADAAVSALIGTLKERQSALLDVTGDTAAAQDTEQLRTALQDYRVFCQDIEEIGQRLPQPQAVTR